LPVRRKLNDKDGMGMDRTAGRRADGRDRDAVNGERVRRFKLRSSTGYLIRRLQQIMVAIFLEHTRKFDITPGQYAALQAINLFPGIDQKQLGGVIAVDRSTAGALVDGLSRRGLIERKTAERDQRYKEIYVNDRGTRLLRAIRPAARTAQETLISRLDTTEAQEFLRLLAKVVELNNDLSRVPVGPPPIGVEGRGRDTMRSRRGRKN
jgi:DNA-binding MarR family transcriptional regulator